ISPITESSSAPRGERTLTGPAIQNSPQESLGRLYTDQIHVLDFHHVDENTPINQQAATIHGEYSKGQFEKIPTTLLFNITPSQLITCSPSTRSMTAQRTSVDADGTWYGSMYNMHANNADFRATIVKLQISESEACLRWIYYHSKLQKGDDVILETNSGPELTQHIKNIVKGPLPAETVINLTCFAGDCVTEEFA
ncbi:hypothetical protein N7447_008292, partial [Penicillium robsamsonii]|uniref:uncharacterized protein n=1 Tax=Penicillium robsamsonii TaxID=1792511 RepID=UPI002548502C